MKALLLINNISFFHDENNMSREVFAAIVAAIVAALIYARHSRKDK